jgi:hypothetical protein
MTKHLEFDDLELILIRLNEIAPSFPKVPTWLVIGLLVSEKQFRRLRRRGFLRIRIDFDFPFINSITEYATRMNPSRLDTHPISLSPVAFRCSAGKMRLGIAIHNCRVRMNVRSNRIVGPLCEDVV